MLRVTALNNNPVVYYIQLMVLLVAGLFSYLQLQDQKLVSSWSVKQNQKPTCAAVCSPSTQKYIMVLNKTVSTVVNGFEPWGISYLFGVIVWVKVQ